MKRIEILGVPVDPMPSNTLIDHIERLHTQGSATVTYANVHVVNTAQNDMTLSAFLHSADLVYCDGNGLRLGAHLLGDAIPARMTGADWIWELAEYAEGTWRLYWLGGAEGVATEAVRVLRSRFPKLEIQTDHGFHPKSGPEDAAVVKRINDYAPDILLVGMGTPTQEMWVHTRRSSINVPVVWCVGATADILAGVEERGPKWLTDRAEWVARFRANPTTKWRRYLLGNPLFIARIFHSRWRR